MKCWVCSAEIPDRSETCPECVTQQMNAAPTQAKPAATGSRRKPPASTDATGGIIPYRNRPALIGYYLGVFSLIPYPSVTCPMGAVAFVLGLVGLWTRKRNPAVKGTLHALVGIIVGGVCAVIWGIAWRTGKMPW